MRKSNGSRLALSIAAFGILGVGALAFYVTAYPRAAQVSPDERRVNVSAPPRVEITAKPTPKAKSNDSGVHLPILEGEEIKLASTISQAPVDADPMTYVGSELVSVLKLEGVKLMSVEVRDHTAILNFNEALAKGMGSMQESTFAKALQTTYGQFKELDAVLVQVEGQPLDSGHFDYTDPLPVHRLTSGEPAKPSE